MRPSRFVIATAAAVALATIGFAPPAHAGPPAPTFFTVSDTASSPEFFLDCTQSPPSECNVVRNTAVYIGVTAHNRPRSGGQYVSITVGYQIVSGTAVAGQDFGGPTSGTLTITPYNQSTTFSVPVLTDGLVEPNETFTVRLTSSSVPADISDTGTATITDGDQFPNDCTVTQNLATSQRSLTCTNRPAGQRWYLVQPWLGWGIEVDYGNLVTGNGTSTSYYNGTPYPSQIHIVP